MALMGKKHNSTVRRKTILVEVSMKNIGAAVIIEYCTGVIWHDLHGAQMMVVNCAVCVIYL